MREFLHGFVGGVLITAVILAVILFLAGCSYPQPPTTACPPITEVPAQTLTQAADELRAPPSKPALEQIVADWIQTRDRLRRCEQ